MSKELSTHSLSSTFSHIYVEKRVLDHEKTKDILKKFKNSHIIMIDHYKDIFNRSHQSFSEQSLSKNLILAARDENFLIEGSYFSDGFEYENFFYTPSILGCLYDCDYCYLQGMYNSANSVIFVNIEDFINDSKKYLDKPTLIAISYDTDTSAIESIAKHNEVWLNEAKKEPNLNLEIRTKSANTKLFLKNEPLKNVVIAWTLSPQTIIDLYEHFTPSIVQRLKAIKSVADLGWSVRISIDPVIYNEDFDKIYPELIDKIFEYIEPTKLFSLTLGSFRMSLNHLKKIKKMRRSDIAFYPYDTTSNMASYPKEIEQNILETLTTHASKYISKEKIRTWQK